MSAAWGKIGFFQLSCNVRRRYAPPGIELFQRRSSKKFSTNRQYADTKNRKLWFSWFPEDYRIPINTPVVQPAGSTNSDVLGATGRDREHLGSHRQDHGSRGRRTGGTTPKLYSASAATKAELATTRTSPGGAVARNAATLRHGFSQGFGTQAGCGSTGPVLVCIETT